MALMELKLFSTMNGIQSLNVFNYLSSGSNPDVSVSFALASAFGAVPSGGTYPSGVVLDAIRGIQGTLVQYQLVEARNVYSDLDFYSAPFNPDLAGAIAGEVLSPTSAFGYRSNRVRLDIRRGHKRFIGVPEAVTGTAGALTVSAAHTLLAARLGNTLNFTGPGGTITFAPCIVKKEQYIPDPTKPDRVAYRYFPSEATQLSNIATGIIWDVVNTVRTQTSRQYGRGN